MDYHRHDHQERRNGQEGTEFDEHQMRPGVDLVLGLRLHVLNRSGLDNCEKTLSPDTFGETGGRDRRTGAHQAGNLGVIRAVVFDGRGILRFVVNSHRSPFFSLCRRRWSGLVVWRRSCSHNLFHHLLCRRRCLFHRIVNQLRGGLRRALLL